MLDNPSTGREASADGCTGAVPDPGPRGELVPYLWSYGMGAESTAGIHRMLTCPHARPDTIAADFSNLVVVIAQTGDEWSTTPALVETHILPLLRAHRVRLVEVARAGPRAADGIAVLQDTRAPHRLHPDGVYRLSDENRASGTLPQLGGVRKCSQRAKGAPLDAWRAAELGDRSYYHALGFNADETARIARDAAYTMGGHRIPTYPVFEWGWRRQDCLDYLHHELGVTWQKSACRQCPYAGCGAGWPQQRHRYATLAAEAAAHLIDEYVCLALNPRSGLFGPGKSLLGRLRRDGVAAPIELAAAQLPHLPWAVYRVRRLYRAPARAVRSVQQVVSGDLGQVIVALEEISAMVGIPLATGTAIPGAPARGADRDTHPRLWLRTRDDTYPALEEFLTRAPARVVDKTGPGFEDAWVSYADPALMQRERRTATAIRFVRHVLTGSTS